MDHEMTDLTGLEVSRGAERLPVTGKPPDATVTRQTLGFWIKAREMAATYEAAPACYQVFVRDPAAQPSLLCHPRKPTYSHPLRFGSRHIQHLKCPSSSPVPLPLWPRAMEISSKEHLPNRQRDPTALFISWISFSLQAQFTSLASQDSPNILLQGPETKESPDWPSQATVLVS